MLRTHSFEDEFRRLFGIEVIRKEVSTTLVVVDVDQFGEPSVRRCEGEVVAVPETAHAFMRISPLVGWHEQKLGHQMDIATVTETEICVCVNVCYVEGRVDRSVGNAVSPKGERDYCDVRRQSPAAGQSACTASQGR